MKLLINDVFIEGVCRQLSLNKDSLRNVNLEISSSDTMYEEGKEGANEHYANTGLQAVAVIDKARELLGKEGFASILDFGCGYGRVLRFLRSYYPKSRITCCEVEKKYVDFGTKTFDVEGFVSNTDFHKLKRDKKFDLIWAGSVFTHLSASKFKDLFKYFEESLNEGGIMVVTTHGRFCLDNFKSNAYGLSNLGNKVVPIQYNLFGYGYRDYSFSKGYGVSIMKSSWFTNFLMQKENLSLVAYYEKYWDNHQDVIVVQKRF